MLPFGLLVVRAYMRVPLETSESRHIGALLILNRAVGIYYTIWEFPKIGEANTVT